MKDPERSTAATRAEADDGWLEQGLRGLREQVPSDESKRATLAHLGLDSARAHVERTVTRAGSRAAAWRSAARWLVYGVLLGIAAIVLRRLME